MACPKCGCKTTYTYCEDDIIGLPGDQERCPACGAIFYVDDSAEDDKNDEFWGPDGLGTAMSDMAVI